MSNLLSFASSIFVIVCMWNIFEKAGEPGWQAIVPVWNTWVLAKIANRKWTFWVQIIMSMAFTALIIIGIVGSLAAKSVVFDNYRDDYYYDEYDYYDDYDYYADDLSVDQENQYIISELTATTITAPASINNKTVGASSGLNDVMSALLSTNGTLFLALLSILLTLPMIIVNFLLNVGLSQAFGQPWAFAFLLTLLKPIGMGILAFSRDMQYVGYGDGGYTPSYNPSNAGGYNASNYQPVESNYNPQPTYNNYQSNTNFNPFDTHTSPCVAPDVTEMPQPKKHRCPVCGYEMDRAPAPDTFCPNCGHLHR